MEILNKIFKDHIIISLSLAIVVAILIYVGYGSRLLLEILEDIVKSKRIDKKYPNLVKNVDGKIVFDEDILSKAISDVKINCISIIKKSDMTKDLKTLSLAFLNSSFIDYRLKKIIKSIFK